MSEKLTLAATVTYADVDRRELMLLSRIFKRLQDAAIEHANRYGAGTNAVTLRAESWILNRIEARVERYPRAGEQLEITTWSTGVKGFKGYRDFRVSDADGHPLLTASSLWLYLSLRTKSLVRVPRDIAERFPMGAELAAFPDLEKRAFAEPSASAPVYPVTLRYGDFDVNDHVNNAAYFEIVQTALGQAGADPRPRHVALKYMREIPVGTDAVSVRCERRGAQHDFVLERGADSFAIGFAE